MQEQAVDHYETLQISPSADPDLIHRVYRVLAQRYHPDNRETGSPLRFREIAAAYSVLSNPETRARYDLTHQRIRRERWKLVSEGLNAENDFEVEQAVRLTVLEVLYTQRRTDPRNPGLYPGELEKLTGTPPEHLDFSMWFLIQKRLLQRADDSRVQVTAEGVEYLEKSYDVNARKRLRLRASAESLDSQCA